MKNKILLDGDNYYIDESINNFEINGHVTIYIINKNLSELTFNLENNSSIEIVNFCEIENKLKLIIKQNDDTTLKYVSNIDVKDSYNLDLILEMNGSNSKSDIIINGVVSGSTSIKVTSIDKEKTIDNEINETIKILNLGGIVHVEPILRVGSRNVIANHSNAITNIDESYLFYLKTKGITEEKAKKLIIDSYKYGLVKKYDIKINNENE